MATTVRNQWCKLQTLQELSMIQKTVKLFVLLGVDLCWPNGGGFRFSAMVEARCLLGLKLSTLNMGFRV